MSRSDHPQGPGQHHRDAPRASATPLSDRTAAAAQPVASTTIHTGAQGLEAGETTVAAAAGSVALYYARPAAATAPLPVLLVVSEVFGVHAHIADVCRRFARLGYLALAPDLFARQGDAAAYADLGELIREVVARTPDAEVLADLDAVAAAAPALGGDPRRLGITGFCWGGRICWLYAAHNPELKAAVAWYGRLDGDTSACSPRHPVALVPALQAPVLGLYAGQDPVVPPAHLEAMQAALRRHGGRAADCAIHLYPAAGHAFFADYRASYRPADAADGWQRCRAWLAAHGVV